MQSMAEAIREEHSRVSDVKHWPTTILKQISKHLRSPLWPPLRNAMSPHPATLCWLHCVSLNIRSLLPPLRFARHTLPSPYLLIAVAVRVLLLLHTHGFIDGDEALVGIQAEHILHGELPVYFYGQPYLGSLEMYLIALLFSIFGPSVWVLRAEPILLSLALVWLTWKLAAALADFAQLPSYARSIFINIAALLAAVPPVYDAVIELRTYGGYIETFLLMLLLLLSVLQLTRRWQAGVSPKELAWRWAGIGLIVGLGFWIHLLIVSALLAATIWIACSCLTQVMNARQTRKAELEEAIRSVLKDFQPAIAAIPTFFLGVAPALLWGVGNHWANVTYVLGLGGDTSDTYVFNPAIQTHYPTHLSLLAGLADLYTKCVAPHVISGALPRESTVSALIHSPLLVIGVFCILSTTTLVIISLRWHHPLLLSTRRLLALPLLFAACTAVIFCMSTTSANGLLQPCDGDAVGRYATPLALALPFFLATVFMLISKYIHEKTEKQTQNVRPITGIRNMLVSYPPLALLGQGILLLLLLTYLGTQFWTYTLADPKQTFQSPFCIQAPVDNEPIIRYMQQEHIHYAWSVGWIGYSIVFKTNGSIIISDPRPVISFVGLGRIPENTLDVLNADRPSMLVFVKHTDPYPSLLRFLDSKQVTYRSVRFPAELGFDVLVVTPLNRTVPIFELSNSSTHPPLFPNCGG